MVEAALHAERQGGEAALTCFGQVPQGGAERAPLQPLAPGVAVVQARPGQRPVPGVLLQAGALRHAGTNHPLLLLQLGCNAHSGFEIGVCRGKTAESIPVFVGEWMPERSFTPLPTAGCETQPLLENRDEISCLDSRGLPAKCIGLYHGFLVDYRDSNVEMKKNSVKLIGRAIIENFSVR